MGKINLGRVVLGGIAAGIVINIFEFALNGVLLADQWPELMKSINRPALGMNEVVYFNVFGFIQGLVAVWTYAAIRPRFGAGPMTAIVAALLTWITSYVLVDGMPTIMGIFPMSMTLMLVGVGLIEILAATLAGAYLYRENASA
ncbi:MAG TPA: hypothetical protein VHZ29_17195 [Rhizomicrobium sp.]|jgi:hypothetical protein|nr:hypothetical protein [Rhizomicrobium sp.]